MANFGCRFPNNLSEYGYDTGIEVAFGVSNYSIMQMYVNDVSWIGEPISQVRFYYTPTGNLENAVYSPYYDWNGVEVVHEWGVIKDSWLRNITSVYGPDYQISGGIFYYKTAGGSAQTGGNFGWVFPYDIPKVNLFDSYRITPETTLEMSLDASISSTWDEAKTLITNEALKNTLTYLFQYKDTFGVWQDIGVSNAASGYTVTLTYQSTGPWAEDSSFQLRVAITDKFFTAYAYDTLPTILVPLSVGKFGIGVGKIIENNNAALDINGLVYRDNILQPKIFSKKPSDPDPDGMENGDVLLIYNETQEFTSTNFPQEFGTGYSWAQAGVWPTDYLFWASTSSSNNPIVKSIEASGWKADLNPTIMLNGSTAWNDNVMFPYGALPATVIITFNGMVQFNSFTIWGWGQGHEPKNSPKSFAFFGSVDGHEWTSLYYTTAFADTYNTSASALMNNSGLYFKYLKMVWISNQNDNNSADLTNATMIALREINFNASGYYYV